MRASHFFRSAFVVTFGLLAAAMSCAQHDLPGGGWTYDPAKDGMKDLRALKPIEGCLAPGGLVKVTSTDEPAMSGPYWCGTPPHCLTEAALPGNWNCTVVPFSRRNPRGDPNGTPGSNGVRDPQDLRCVNTGLQPIAGRCPMPPTVSATLNGQLNLTVLEGTQVTLRVNSSNATGLRQDCSGVNTAITPMDTRNLNSLAGQTNGTYGPGTPLVIGATSCTITASNDRGSATTVVSLNVTARAVAPTIHAEFTNSPVPVGSTKVTLRTRTTNATGNITWRCTGIWNFSDTRPASNGGWYMTHHNQGSGSAAGRSSTCTFTASGPGGNATTTATWRAVAASGGGGGSGGSDPQIPATGCNGSVNWYEPVPGPSRNRCTGNVGARTNGWVGNVQGSVTYNPNGAIYGYQAEAKVRCQAGTYVVIGVYTCGGYDGTGNGGD